ncbi:MAG: hypothetical protein AB7X49_26385, partial [Geminicoccaceae bacterium]
MAAQARRYDFDLVLAADFRGQGETIETVAAHLACLADQPWQIGLWHLPDPTLPPGTTLNRRITAATRAHAVVPIPPDADSVRARIVLVYSPHLLALPCAARPLAQADLAVVVLAEAPPARDARLPDLGLTAARIDGGIASRQLWCPAADGLRARLSELAPGLPIWEQLLPPFEPMAAWRTERAATTGRRPVLGRMLQRGDERLPAQRDTILQAHPIDDDLQMRFRGGAKLLAERVKPLPAAWRLLDPASVGAKRFLGRLDFYVHHQDETARQPPRGVLQAMAAGRVVVAAPSCRGAIGGGPAYRDPDQVADTARYLHAEPRFYRRYLEEQDAAVAERFGPGPLLELLTGPGRLRKRRHVMRPAPPRPVAFYPTNGIGLGHVTRLLAVARRLPEGRGAVFFTPCHALGVIEHAGYSAEYVAEPAYDETDPADHAAAMAPRLLAMLRHYDPAVVVFDGNVPREWLLAACAEVDLPLVWIRRGMWRADPALARHLDHGTRFDAVMEPAEAAAALDRGPTATAPDAPIKVPPVMMLDRQEIEHRQRARATLGLAADRPTLLVQPGAGNNHDIEPMLDRVAEAQAWLGLQVVVAEWLIRHGSVRRPGLRSLSLVPSARYLAAV